MFESPCLSLRQYHIAVSKTRPKDSSLEADVTGTAVARPRWITNMRHAVSLPSDEELEQAMTASPDLVIAVEGQELHTYSSSLEQRCRSFREHTGLSEEVNILHMLKLELPTARGLPQQASYPESG